MLDFDVIQNRGFANLVENGQVTGFTVSLRNPNYRGLSSSLVDGVTVTVDGRTWPREQTLVELQGRRFALDELRHSTGARWNLDEPATIVVPHAGGLKPGVHQVAVDVYLRAPYFPIEFQPNIFHAERTLTLVGPVAGPFKYGVSTYSYTGDFNASMTMDDVMAEIAGVGGTGIEILSEGNIPAYPTPSTAWVDAWHAGLQKYGLQATNLGTWVDTRMWLDRDLSVEEGTAQLAQDLRLASRLGFSFLRPKFGVISQDLIPHPIWTQVVERNLDLAAELGIVIAPEIHPPTPIKHPVVDDYIALVERTGTKNFGLLIDTGIFMTAAAVEPLDGKAPDEEDIPVPMRPLRVPPTDLLDVMPYVVFVQAKFYEVDENLNDLHIPWLDVLRALRDGGYDGWLSSEYEGRRVPYRGREMVRRQHAMFHELAAQL